MKTILVGDDESNTAERFELLIPSETPYAPLLMEPGPACLLHCMLVFVHFHDRVLRRNTKEQ